MFFAECYTRTYEVGSRKTSSSPVSRPLSLYSLSGTTKLSGTSTFSLTARTLFFHDILLCSRSVPSLPPFPSLKHAGMFSSPKGGTPPSWGGGPRDDKNAVTRGRHVGGTPSVRDGRWSSGVGGARPICSTTFFCLLKHTICNNTIFWWVSWKPTYLQCCTSILKTTHPVFAVLCTYLWTTY